jgi:putative FmdB family regulatory protein
MPTYEYVCTDCQNHWEEVQKISEPALEVCPKCSKKTAKRQISGGNFILKGGGWYADLYSSSGSKKSNGEGKAETGGTSTEAAKSDSGSAASGSSGSSTSEKSSGASSTSAPPPKAPSKAPPK